MSYRSKEQTCLQGRQVCCLFLENDTDLRYIQNLPDHNRSRTNEIFTHVVVNTIKTIESPLDSLSLIQNT